MVSWNQVAKTGSLGILRESRKSGESICVNKNSNVKQPLVSSLDQAVGQYSNPTWSKASYKEYCVKNYIKTQNHNVFGTFFLGVGL